MGYLIGFLGLGSLVVGLVGVGLGNRALVITSAVMFLAFLLLCVVDALRAGSQGTKGNHPFNWVVLSRYTKKRKK